MKNLKLFFALFAMLALGVGNAWGENAPVNTVLWGENFAHFGTKTPSNAKTGTGTTIYDGASITYTQSSTSTKAYNEKLAGGTAPELLLSKSNQTWTISGIKTGGATKMSLTFLSNKTTFGVTVSSASLSVSGSQKSWTITLKDGQTVPETFDLTIKNTGSSNARIDNVELKVTVAGTNTEPVTTYSVTLNQPANGTISATGLTDGKAAEGTIVKLTATPDAGYKWESWTVTGASGNVAVSNDQFTMPAEDVTVTASFIAKPRYTITWNNAGSTTEATVVQGAELGELPTVADCSNGKKFMGWSATDNFASDGSDITYVKKTDVPTGNTTYYAVFAVIEGDAGTPTTATVSISDYATEKNWVNSTQYGTVNIDANITATATGGGNTGKYYTSGTNWRIYQNENPSLTISAAEGYEIQTVKVTYTVSNTGVLTLDGSNVNSETACEVNAASVTFGVGNTGTATNGQVRITAIEVVYALAAETSDYSLDCTIHTEPTWTISKDAIDFADKYVGFEYTETFTVNANNLTENISLAIDGSNFTVSPTSIATDAEFPQTVTVTYAPTAVGTHNATLNITSGSTLSKTIALTGSATEATIYTLTALADINPTDKVIIVGTSSGNTYAMSNDKGTSDAPDAIAVTVIDNKIATDKTNILWNIAKDGDNLTIYPADQTAKWLYCLADNNDGVRVGTGEAKLFTIDKGYLYTTQTTAARHIGIYNNSDWRCYKPSADAIHTNIKDQSFAFYVLPNTDPFISATPTSYDFGAVLKGKQTTEEIAYTTTNISSSISVTISNPECFTVVHNSTTKICTVTYTPNAVGTHSATLTIKAEDEASTTVELTGECVETVDVATAMALAKDEIAYFDEFEVVKVVAGKGNIYIKDASGHGLIYDFTLAGQLKDGDRVQGFVGISSPYNGLPEAKPHNVTYADLTITTGTPAQPYDFTSTVIAETDVNKYIVFQNVEIVENTDMSTNPTLTIGGNSVDFYNQFGVSKTLEAGKIYDIYGFVAIKAGKLDVYFYEAAQDGEVIQKYTVTYNAGGATGTVPVDNAEYSEGAQVYLKSATDLTYEGYEYKGWKVTDANGTEIPVSSNKFNMPASNVTVTAQWEEIVVTPTEDFSAGLWVLVTDASELAANDYIIVAAAAENFAMKSYESGNNCKQVAITKFGNNNCFLTWTEEIGVFQLLANGSNYTIQDVNTKQYLYAAGSGTSNQLKANNNIATDENASKYVWTIAVDENGIATVKATSENRNWLRYNTNSGSDLFSCYGSGQQDIVLYKYVTDFYTRDVISGNLGTICLPYASSKHAGATFYEIAYLEMNGTDPNRIYLDEVEGGVLEAGKPYIFQATSNKVTVAYEGEASSLKEGVKGLVGILEDSKVVNGQEGVSNILTGNYVISGTKFYTCGTGCSIYKNRAYIDASIIANHTTPVAEMPGRRRIAMGAAGENQVTGVDNTLAPKDNVVKVIENGQLIIIRDGVKYNVQGQKL